MLVLTVIAAVVDVSVSDFLNFFSILGQQPHAEAAIATSNAS